jgi:acetyl-CoA synthetase
MSEQKDQSNPNNRRFPPSAAFVAHAHVQSHAEYSSMYRKSLDEPEEFWREETSDLVWREPWKKFTESKLDDKSISAKFFLGGVLNLTESCLDRHLSTAARHKAAIVFEGEPGDVRTITYFELHSQVVRMTAALASLGVKKGDRVAIYMGMVPETAVAMLACARLGAPHSVVFGGFSSEALRDRINDLGAKVLITQDAAWRRGSVVPLKKMADVALEQSPQVEKVIVYERIGKDKAPIDMKEGRDVYLHDLLQKQPDPKWLEAAKKPEGFDSEHPLFVLYTSGSTGKPKGVLHTTGGYLAGAHVTSKYVFDLRESDLYWCTADVGWVTGHSYLVYGPLSCGASIFMYEGAPNQPDWGRFWSMIEKHGISILYTAPTAIRAFIRAGDEWPKKYDLSSLRLLGSVGEPINPEAWTWYHREIGKGNCPIVDTWWQTETGSIMLTTLPGACYSKPGATGLPLFGVEIEVVDDNGKKVAAAESGKLVIKRPWPSMARTLWKDDDRYFKTYWGVMKNVYFTGDGARQDEDGYFWVNGRIDDVLNVAGHRIGTAEVESAIVTHPMVAEAAAVGKPDDLKGQAIVVFVTLKSGQKAGPDTKAKLNEIIDKEIGKFARPDQIRFTDALPKTRSGKIMRRLLKEVASGNKTPQGDTSTLEDFSVLAKLGSDED